MNPDMEIGIIYTHERHFILPLLNSLQAAWVGLNARLLLVDNHSNTNMDEFKALVTPLPVKIITNNRRLNYARNLNVILQHSTAKYVLLMNTDMWFVENEPTLKILFDFMESMPRCGMTVARIIGKDGEFMFPARRFPTIKAILSRRLPVFFNQKKNVEEHLYANRDLHAIFECDWVSGCFMLVRKEAIKETGLFDEGFEKYFEDVDFAARMWEKNWKVMYCGEASCVHLEQKASKRLISKDAFYHLKSYFRFLRKCPRKSLMRAINDSDLIA